MQPIIKHSLRDNFSTWSKDCVRHNPRGNFLITSHIDETRAKKKDNAPTYSLEKMVEHFDFCLKSWFDKKTRCFEKAIWSALVSSPCFPFPSCLYSFPPSASHSKPYGYTLLQNWEIWKEQMSLSIYVLRYALENSPRTETQLELVESRSQTIILRGGTVM